MNTKLEPAALPAKKKTAKQMVQKRHPQAYCAYEPTPYWSAQWSLFTASGVRIGVGISAKACWASAAANIRSRK